MQSRLKGGGLGCHSSHDPSQEMLCLLQECAVWPFEDGVQGQEIWGRLRQMMKASSLLIKWYCSIDRANTHMTAGIILSGNNYRKMDLFAHFLTPGPMRCTAETYWLQLGWSCPATTIGRWTCLPILWTQNPWDVKQKLAGFSWADPVWQQL